MGGTEIFKLEVFSIIGVAGGFIAGVFGGWSTDLQTLIIFMCVDFMMGVLLAGIFQNSSKTKSGALESKAGWKGLCRKCVTLLFVLVAYRLDIAIGVAYIKTAVVIGFIANETVSIVENAGLMGVPLPQAIVKAIEVLKNKAGQEATKDNIKRIKE